MSADSRAIAKQYVDDGWAVVPLVKGEKRASTSWQKKKYTPKDFGTDDGIAGKCGEPSAWRVDVDLDSAEAVAAAAQLLPNTGLIHGRPGKPDSHYWFVCEGIKTTQFQDVKGTDGKTSMLVEIRSTGGYTALPPSHHPSGDVLSWTRERAPLTMTPDDLYAAVRSVALAALLARHWPGPGARHAAAGHLAGFLCQGDIDSAMVIEIIKAAATIAGDSDLHDRLNIAQSTVTKFRAGEHVTGGPKLAEAVGEHVVNKMRGWLRLADTDALEEMNQRHFFVRLGAKSVIGREDDPSGTMFQPVRELYAEYANRQVQTGTDKDGGPKYAPLFETWLKSTQRRQYIAGVVMLPPPLEARETEYNLWKGFAIDEAPGCCDRIHTHIKDVICSGNEENYQYLLDWTAFCVQYPGDRPGVAVVLRGKQGTGKGTFVELFEAFFGRHHYTHLDRTKELVEWNSLVSGKVVVFADEAFFAGDKQNIGALKRIITEPTIRISRKHIDSTEERNCIHLVMATNEEWAIPAGHDERRFFALQVSDAHKQDEAYFKPLRDEMQNGGVAAFLYEMQRRLVTAASVRNRPKTEELRTQQNQSLDPHLKWWRECLHDGRVNAFMVPWDSWVPTQGLYDAYKLWAKDYGRLLDKMEFGRRMSTLFSASKSQGRRSNGNSERCWLFRTLADAQATFNTEMGTEEEWSDAPGASQVAIPF